MVKPNQVAVIEIAVTALKGGNNDLSLHYSIENRELSTVERFESKNHDKFSDYTSDDEVKAGIEERLADIAALLLRLEEINEPKRQYAFEQQRELDRSDNGYNG